ncbi:FecCD family ABC transporter permease [Rothia sp. P5766]|uniref:FecCD family ABC transporter permease n=1 Tax=Rothia sp. P5766 TaxID=3402656 RepID=UPI003AEA6B77
MAKYAKAVMGDIQRPVIGKRSVWWFLLFLTLLGISIALSLFWGSHQLDSSTVLQVLGGQGPDQAQKIIWEQRIPRTGLALVCGAALALAGSLMQSLTRNPLAEPGLLGINAGASVAVVLSVVLWGAAGIYRYMGAALVGACLATLAVYLLGRGARSSIIRLALAGVALSAALSALNQVLILSNQEAYDEFRFWVAGSLQGRGSDVFLALSPLLGLGFLLAFWVTPAINALAMGEESAISLGVNLKKTYFLTLVVVTLLAGLVTAAIGPIAFVGLAVPYMVRYFVGNDLRWVNLGSMILGPCWLLSADVLARLIFAPQETHVGIIATLVGAPFFVIMMSRRKEVVL